MVAARLWPVKASSVISGSSAEHLVRSAVGSNAFDRSKGNRIRERDEQLDGGRRESGNYFVKAWSLISELWLLRGQTLDGGLVTALVQIAAVHRWTSHWLFGA